MARRRILVTTADTRDVVECARDSLSPGRGRGTISLAGLPSSFESDQVFGPVPIRCATVKELHGRISRHGIAGHHSYVLRGMIDEEHLEAAQGLTADGTTRVFADPGVALVVSPVAFGDPPVGSVADVRRLLRLPTLFADGVDGHGSAIAIVDNGVNVEYLRQKGIDAEFDESRSWVASGAGPGLAQVGHGTMCAFDALIAAPRAKLLDFAAIRSKGAPGSAVSGILSDVLAAYGVLLRLVTLSVEERGFESLVVSNSWAVPNPKWDFPPGHPGRYLDNPDHPFRTAVADLVGAGADVVFAAGNCGPQCPESSCAFEAGQPTIVGASAYPEVLTVAAVDVEGHVTGYSSHGPGAIQTQKPDLAAFAHFLGSEAFGPGQPDAGTSAACPVMAGVVAAIRSKYPYVASDESRSTAAIKQRIISAAAGVGSGFLPTIGHGIVNLDFMSVPPPGGAREPTSSGDSGVGISFEPPAAQGGSTGTIMAKENDLVWKLSAEGTFDDIRRFMTRGRLGGGPRSPAATQQSLAADIAGASGTHTKTHRSKDGLIETHVLEASGEPNALVQLVRQHWALLRDKGFAAAQPVKIFTGSDDPHTIVYVFRWKDAESRTVASADKELAALVATIRSASVSRERLPLMNEVYQGFETRTFPRRGGIELLRGKCTCRVQLDGIPGEFELDGQNGFVIMHRGPRTIQGDSRLMPVNILAHGADSPAAVLSDLAKRADVITAFRSGSAATVVGSGAATSPQPVSAPSPGAVAKRVLMSGTRGPNIRVEQNTELPQFGIIRALGPDADFPATAMWVVHWRIHTPLGTVITDPKVPLVFGPTTVQHYPPVGTEFKSATGPVDIYHQDTGAVVGKLTPGELTAFDIVVTMDDEIPSAMDTPTAYHVEMFNKMVPDQKQQISTEGLLNDYRVPAPREEH